MYLRVCGKRETRNHWMGSSDAARDVRYATLESPAGANQFLFSPFAFAYHYHCSRARSQFHAANSAYKYVEAVDGIV
jgi:hypothetical protein